MNQDLQHGVRGKITRGHFLALGAGAGAGVALSGLTPRSPEAARQSARGLERAHAHNDYEHERPLFDALSHGFKSVEADIWLTDGRLVVSHERPVTAIDPGRTLTSLYLEPLGAEVARNGGSVYAGDPDYFTLLVDIKSEAEPTYRALHEELQRYRDTLTTFGPRGVRDGAVTVIVSGNRPRELMASHSLRYAGYDGRLEDLGSAEPQTFMPLISDNWPQNFTWQGVGPMPAEERERLRAIVETAHGNGRRVRFYATPELPEAREAVWAELLAAKVDYVNTDHLAALEEFLVRNDPRPYEPHVYWSGSGGRSL